MSPTVQLPDADKPRTRNIPRMITCLLLAMFLPVMPASAIDNDTLNVAFERYERRIDLFIRHMTQQSWIEAELTAISLTELGEELLTLGKAENIPTWEYYASNLTHHGQELQEACKRQDSHEAVYLIATLINHLGEIQSAIPVWLLEHLRKQILELEQGIANQNHKTTRNAAEVIHNSAHKIILSASTSRQSYRHTRWLTNLLDLNRLGDQLVGGESHGDDWTAYEGHMKRIQSIYATWKDGFHPVALPSERP
ncbi:MAG: hypothetical protein HQM00_00370 [Magnetococcales bacterium]|nr:hypothetical protein [Magnetococcales bacterium]